MKGMEGIELVIKIPKAYYELVIKKCKDPVLLNAFKNSTPLPKGHGRLIDADALEKRMCDREKELGDDKALWESSAVSVALDIFAPTIIEADTAESEGKQ